MFSSYTFLFDVIIFVAVVVTVWFSVEHFKNNNYKNDSAQQNENKIVT